MQRILACVIIASILLIAILLYSRSRSRLDVAPDARRAIDKAERR